MMGSYTDIVRDTETFVNIASKFLWRGGKYAYWWLKHADGYKETVWFSAGIPAPVPCDNDADIYFAIHSSPYSKRHNERATNREVEVVNCLYADCDIKDFGSDAAITNHLKKYPPANIIIASGGGQQLIWLLAEPIPCWLYTQWEYARNLQRRWTRFVNADPAACDLARVLRVPGTYNHKYEPARRVQLIHLDTTRLYTLEELEELLPPEEPEEPTQHNGNGLHPPAAQDVQRRLQWALQHNSYFRELWTGSTARHNGDESRAEEALFYQLVHYFGCDEDLIIQLFLQSNLPHLRTDKKDKPFRDDYLKRSVRNAIELCTKHGDFFIWPRNGAGNGEADTRAAANSVANQQAYQRPIQRPLRPEDIRKLAAEQQQPRAAQQCQQCPPRVSASDVSRLRDKDDSCTLCTYTSVQEKRYQTGHHINPQECDTSLPISREGHAITEAIFTTEVNCDVLRFNREMLPNGTTALPNGTMGVTKRDNLCVTKRDNSVRVSAEDVLSLVERLGEMCTASRVASLLGISVDAAKKHLHRLAADGRIIRMGAGKYVPLRGWSVDAGGAPVEEFAVRWGCSYRAALMRLRRLEQAGKARRLGGGVYVLVEGEPADGEVVRVERFGGAYDWKPTQRTWKVVVQLDDGRLCSTLVSSSTTDKRDAFLAAGGVTWIEDLAGKRVRVAVDERRKRGKVFLEIVGIFSPDGRLIWRTHKSTK